MSIFSRTGTQTSSAIPTLNKTLLKSGNPLPPEDFVRRQRHKVRTPLVGLTTRQNIRNLPGLGLSVRLRGSTGYFIPARLKQVGTRLNEGSFDSKLTLDLKGDSPEMVQERQAQGVKNKRSVWMDRAELAVKASRATPPPAGTPTLSQRETAWLKVAQDHHQPELAARPAEAARKAALARDALVMQLRTELAQARAATPPDAPSIEQCTAAALAACVPELCSSTGVDVQRARQGVVESLAKLDRHLADKKAPHCPLDLLLDVVCNFGNIRNTTVNPSLSTLDALNELKASLDDMLMALSSPCDGASLDHLVGLSAELDGALFSARVTATTDLLMVGAGHDTKTPLQAQKQRKQAASDATEIVKAQFDLAKARLRLQNTLRTEGIAPPPVNLLSGHFDTAALRRQLGPNAVKVGLILDAIQILQDKLKASPHVEKLRESIEKAREHLDSSSTDYRQHSNYLVNRLSQLPVLHRAKDHVIDIRPDPRDEKYPVLDEKYPGLDRKYPVPDVVIDVKTPPVPVPVTHPADERTLRLVRDGMTSEGSTTQAYKAMNEVMTLIRPRLQDFDAVIVAAGKDEDKAQRLGDALLRKLLNQHDDTRISVKTANQPGICGDLKKTIGKQLEDCKLGVPTGQALLLQEQIGDLSDELIRLDGIKARCKSVLQAYGIHSDHPAGRRSCAMVREALHCLAQVERGGASAQNASDKLDQLCEALSDFNPQKLRTSRSITDGPQIEFTRAKLKELAGNALFVQAVEALVTLRESQALEQDILTDLADGLDRMSEQLASRRATIGEAGYAVLRDAVRAAILHVASGSLSLCWFQPADKAKDIMKLLEDWGVPVAKFDPEINAMLSESFGPDELAVWQREAGAPAMPATMPHPDDKGVESKGMESKGIESRVVESAQAQADLALEGKYPVLELTDQDEVTLSPEDFVLPAQGEPIAPDRRANEQARQALIDSVDRLQLSTRVRYTGGSRIALNSGSVTTGPGSPLGLGGRLVGSKVIAFEVGRGADAYEIVLRTGGDLRAGLGAIGNIGSIPNVPVTPKAEIAGAIDGVINLNEGVVLRFPNDDKGRELTKKALAVLIDKNPIEPGDLPEGTNVCKFDEQRLQGKVSGGARLGVEFNITEPDRLGSQGRKTGTLPAAMGSARVAGASQYQYTSQQAMSPNGGVRRTFKEGTGESTLGGVGTLRTGSRVLGGQHSASGDALEAGGWVGWTGRAREKVVLDSNGMVIGSTEIDRQLFMPPGGHRMMRTLAPKAFRKLMTELEKSSAPDRQRLASDINALIQSVTTNQMFSVVSGLDPRVAAAINRKQSEANALRTGMMQSRSGTDAARRADQLERQAKAMLEDHDNYYIHRIRVMDQYDNLGSKTYFDLGMLRWSNVQERQAINPIADARPTPALAREIHDMEPQEAPGQQDTPPQSRPQAGDDQDSFTHFIGSGERKTDNGSDMGVRRTTGASNPSTLAEQRPLLSKDFESKYRPPQDEARTGQPVTLHPLASIPPESAGLPLIDTKQYGPPVHTGMIRADFERGAVAAGTRLTVGRPNGAGSISARFGSVAEPHRPRNAIWVSGPENLLPADECLSMTDSFEAGVFYYLLSLEMHTVTLAPPALPTLA